MMTFRFPYLSQKAKSSLEFSQKWKTKSIVPKDITKIVNAIDSLIYLDQKSISTYISKQPYFLWEKAFNSKRVLSFLNQLRYFVEVNISNFNIAW